MIPSVVALAAILIAAISFIASQWEVRRRAKLDYVGQLEKRIEECEDDRDDLHKRVRVLREENLDLMRRVIRLEEK